MLVTVFVLWMTFGTTRLESLRLKTSAPLLVMMPVPRLPLDPPLPTYKSPKLFKIGPVNEFVPEFAMVNRIPSKSNPPGPVRLPVPEKVYALLPACSMMPELVRVPEMFTVLTLEETTNKTTTPTKKNAAVLLRVHLMAVGSHGLE